MEAQALETAPLYDPKATEKPVPLVLLSTETHPSAQLLYNKSVLQGFPADKPFFPVFIEGSLGKSSLMARLTDSQGSLESSESDPDGVYVWPHPVQLGDISILPLKLRRAAHEDASYLQLRRKVKACFMLLSSVWVICEDSRAAVFEAMENFTRDYEHMCTHIEVRISKVYVFVQKSWFKRVQDSNKLKAILEKQPELWEIRHREDKESEADTRELVDFATLLGQDGQHRPFHELIRDTLDFRIRYINLLGALLNIANLDLRFGAFLPKLMDLSTSEQLITDRLEAIKRRADNASLIQNSAQAFDLVTFPRIGPQTHPSFNESILESIQQAYDLSAPTIILSVMGHPGCGKSTFLNYITQYCIESPHLPSIFKVGNTRNRTTRTSQVLSHPLYVKNTQLMLIDLESIEGTEARDIRVVMGVMTISSVLAIIVTNDIAKMNKVKSDIEMLVQMNQSKGYTTERVFLLFHDRHPDAGINPQFEEIVNGLNARLFEGREVVKMLNKPNFQSVDEEIRETFLSTFLKDCVFVKKRLNEEAHVQVQELLASLSVVSQGEELLPRPSVASQGEEDTQISDYIVIDSYESEKDIVEAKCKALKKLAQDLQSQDDIHLVRYFEAAYSEQFAPSVSEALANKHTQSQRLRRQIDLERKRLKSKLASLESCYGMIRAYSEDHMQLVIEQLVEYRYKSTWSVFSFRTSMNKLKKKLTKIQAHFPEGRHKLHRLIEHLNKVWDLMTIDSTAKIGIQVVALGSAVLLSPVGAVVAGAFATYGVFTTTRAITKAEELLYVDSWRNKGTLNAAVVKSLSDRPDSHTPVLLFIGSKSTRVAAFASSFIRSSAPFTPTEFAAFEPSRYAQILLFDYIHPLAPENTVSHAFLICLRMKKKPTSKYAQAMLRIATTLIPAASLTCILSDRPDSYAQAVLSSSLPASKSLSEDAEKPILLCHSHQAVTELSPPIHYESHHVDSFSDDVFSVLMEQVKGKFDKGPVRDSSILLNQILTLPTGQDFS